jgi:hypothetical protein
MKDDGTVWRSANRNCPACGGQRLHTIGELKVHHPLSGHGFDGNRWSHPMLDPQYDRPMQAQALAGAQWRKP